MKSKITIIILALSLLGSMVVLAGCGDDETDGTQDYNMLGTWYAEKTWSVPTQFDWDGFDTYVLREWHSFESNGVLRVKNSFHLKPNENSDTLTLISENPWGNEDCEWSISGKMLTWTYSNKVVTKNIVHDTYTDTTSVNGSLIEMTYSKQS